MCRDDTPAVVDPLLALVLPLDLHQRACMPAYPGLMCCIVTSFSLLHLLHCGFGGPGVSVLNSDPLSVLSAFHVCVGGKG